MQDDYGALENGLSFAHTPVPGARAHAEGGRKGAIVSRRLFVLGGVSENIHADRKRGADGYGQGNRAGDKGMSGVKDKKRKRGANGCE